MAIVIQGQRSQLETSSSPASTCSKQEQKARKNLPLGLAILSNFCGIKVYLGNRKLINSAIVFLVWLTYITFHAARKVFSTIKPELQGCDPIKTPGCSNTGFAPFNAENSNRFISILDALYFAAYSIVMLITGPLGDRTSHKWIVTIGCFLSGALCASFALLRYFDIHNKNLLYAMFIFTGAAQGLGLSPCLTILQKFFKGHSNRATIFGFFNTSPFLGNILGMYLGTYFLKFNWAYSFLVPGAICMVMSLIILLFLFKEPEIVGYTDYEKLPEQSVLVDDKTSEQDEYSKLLQNEGKLNDEMDSNIEQDVSETSCWSCRSQKLVLFYKMTVYILCILCCKSVIYMFFNWTSVYLQNVPITGVQMTPKIRMQINTLFDVGNLFGSLIGGILTYLTNTPVCVIVLGQILTGGMFYIFELFTKRSLAAAMGIFFCLGVASNIGMPLIGSYMTTSLSNDKDKNPILSVSKVSSIVNGVGSIGSAIIPIALPWCAEKYGWSTVVYLMSLLTAVGALVLVGEFYYEVKGIPKRIQNSKQ